MNSTDQLICILPGRDYVYQSDRTRLVEKVAAAQSLKTAPYDVSYDMPHANFQRLLRRVDAIAAALCPSSGVAPHWCCCGRDHSEEA